MKEKIIFVPNQQPKSKKEIMLEELKQRENDRRNQELAKKPLRLKKIIVEGLFNSIDYDIDFENGHDTSILIAPNGCGKTTIFSIINFIFNGRLEDYLRIINIPFNTFTCILSNGKRIVLSSAKEIVNARVVRELGMNSRETEGPSFEYMMTDSAKEIRTLSIQVENEQSLNLTEEVIKCLKDFSVDELLYRESERNLMNGKPSKSFHSVSLSAAVTTYLNTYNCLIPVNFISADRLHNSVYDLGIDRRRGRSFYNSQESMNIDPIIEAKNTIRNRLRDITDRYTVLQAIAKDKLPRLYLNVNEPSLSLEEFIKEWEMYVSVLQKYEEIGFIDESDTILSIKEIKEKYGQKGAFLNIYLSSYKETLSPFEEVYKMYKLFIDIFNERNRVTKKRIKYSPEGVELFVKNHEKENLLSLNCLSSGEKNDFMMFFRLIFESEYGGLVLIDEPEISLHIEWQESFINSLIEICNLNGLQAIVATHSPNIVNGHLELYAEKGIGL